MKTVKFYRHPHEAGKPEIGQLDMSPANLRSYIETHAGCDEATAAEIYRQVRSADAARKGGVGHLVLTQEPTGKPHPLFQWRLTDETGNDLGEPIPHRTVPGKGKDEVAH